VHKSTYKINHFLWKGGIAEAHSVSICLKCSSQMNKENQNETFLVYVNMLGKESKW
jgi:hypothetical protein